MMASTALERSPGLLGLYARAAAGSLPGASHLGLLAGGGDGIPELIVTLAAVPIEAGRLAAYRQVCGFERGRSVPATYPHVLAFPLQMALMTDRAFPFAVVGLVHLENEITQHRPLEIGERLSIAVTATQPRRHPRGRTFDLLTTVHEDGEVLWEERSRMLRREAPQGPRRPRDRRRRGGGALAAEWRCPEERRVVCAR